MASPSMVPTESSAGLSEPAAAAPSNAANKIATPAANATPPGHVPAVNRLIKRTAPGSSSCRGRFPKRALFNCSLPYCSDAETLFAATLPQAPPILYADLYGRRSQAFLRTGLVLGDTRIVQHACVRAARKRSRWRSLRHAIAKSPVVAPHPDPVDRRRRLLGDSYSGTNAPLRSAGLATCRADVRREKTVHLGLLAPRDYPGRVVGSKSRHRGDEYDCVRRAVDPQGDRMAGLRHRAGQLFPGRIARPRGHGQTPRAGLGVRVYDRWTARPALRRQARSGDARAQDWMSGPGVSHRR